ncbi:hypothetical protein GQ53DRAFT_839333 [Thozetella sp. PMI_491]|nr:hypothetical protein GQ53DRAFT_839333 [Thozetella sp. PMI_491]
MVGVPGKYKGCNTCRLRRVKCDNERPFCRKCVDSGRECAGYERETVFIIGTIEDGGRCSSHPPRVVKSKRTKAQAAAKTPEMDEKSELVPLEPLRPAWDDLIAVSAYDRRFRVQLATLQTNLQGLARAQGGGEDGGRFRFARFPAYEPRDVRPLVEEKEFELRSQALVHLSPVQETLNEVDGTIKRTESICVFLYDHNNSVLFGNQAPWRDPAAQGNLVRQQGPESYRSFPNHHFFVRVYRPNAICAALLNRKPLFLSAPEWTTTPWESHPKSFFDQLFDIIVLLPTVFANADRIFPHDPTTQRRMVAQDILSTCIPLDRQFDEWFAAVNPHGGTHQPTVFWVEDASSSPHAQIPFADTFAFVDGLHALMFIYYWTALVIFYPCISALHETIFQPVVDAFPQVYPNLPAHLQAVDPMRYSAKEVRELAANVCRSLDYALNATVQPDMLVTPLFVVEEFYREINSASGDGQLELMWCEAFRHRLAAKGQDIADVVQGRGWQYLANW